MTVEEKRKAICEYCDKRWDDGHLCSKDETIVECPLYHYPTQCGEDENEDIVKENYDKLINAGLIKPNADEYADVYSLSKDREIDEILTELRNSVNHPPHYNADGAMECIDEMLLIFGKEATMHFCLCNAWKYRYRANDKNGKEDMDKANWYIAKYKELKEEA